MYCANCGKQVIAGKNYCPHCGESIAGRPESQETVRKPISCPESQKTPVSAQMDPTQFPNASNAGFAFADQQTPHQTLGIQGLQGEEPDAYKGKGLGVLLCVFGPLCWLLTIIPLQLLYGFSIIASAVGACMLPLTIVLMVVGLREHSASKTAQKVDKAGNHHSMFRNAALALALACMIYGFMFPYFYLIYSFGFSPTFSKLLVIPFYLRFALFAASGVFLIMAARRKKNLGQPSASITVSGILLLVFGGVSQLLLELVTKYFGFSGVYILISALGLLLCGTAVIILGINIMPKRERVGIASTTQSGIQTVAGDGPSTGYAVLGFFFPLIGFILFLVWKDQFPLKAKSCGKGALIGVIVVAGLSLLSVIGVFIFLSLF